jgi:hypothetical protein
MWVLPVLIVLIVLVAGLFLFLNYIGGVGYKVVD